MARAVKVYDPELLCALNSLIAETKLTNRLLIDQNSILGDYLTSFDEVKKDLKEIITDLEITSNKPTKLEIQFEGEIPGMPGKETDIQTVSCAAVETDADNQPVTFADPTKVVWAIDDPTIATLTQNPDGSATFKALKPGTANVSVTDNSVTPPIVGTDTLTVTTSAASGLSLVFGTPAP